MTEKKTKAPAKSKQSRTLYFNRELSWLRFNERVLREALDPTTPTLERLKFLAIVSSNFDEFFMVRVAGLKRQVMTGDARLGLGGMTPQEQLKAIRRRVLNLVRMQYRCLRESVFPLLEKAGISFPSPGSYTQEQRNAVADRFSRELVHTLTPLTFDPDRALPVAGSTVLFVAFSLVPADDETKNSKPRYAVIPVPRVLKRIFPLPAAVEGQRAFGLLEDVILLHARQLFPGYEIKEQAVFRVTRDADLSVDEARDEDFVEAMAEILVNRERSFPVRLEICTTSPGLRRFIIQALGMARADVYESSGPLDLKAFMKMAFINGWENLKAPDWQPQSHPLLPDEAEELWSCIRTRDVLLHHPYQSFNPILKLLATAAVDPQVLAIKIILYRTSGDSPIIKALRTAAENGKQVTAVVELKARFDEGQNIEWARQLERAGVIVVYGIAQLKIHAKATLIIRRESGGIQRYAHLGTGNYNESTARLYTDLSLLTAHEEITRDVALVFNTITGHSAMPQLAFLAIAPTMIRPRLKQLVEREIQRSSPESPGLIMAKINSLACPAMADLLYRASNAGVRILLNVRGICCLRPGIFGYSENIRVVSIVDRFLEHSRIYYFGNGDAEEDVYLASADWMPRNLDRRVELMFPIIDPALKKEIRRILESFFADNTKAHELLADGRYRKVKVPHGEKKFRCQEAFQAQARIQAEVSRPEVRREFVVRRTPPKQK